MKFSEKLQTLRKENKMSQEQLADMMDVSRQAVSKWESGSAYPEMDKLLTLCKIFNCSLDDLTNDEVTEINVEKNTKPNIKNIVESFFVFIKKIYYLITNMSFFEIIKMFIGMLIIFSILYVCQAAFIYFITSLTSGFSNNVAIYTIGHITMPIIKIILAFLSLIIFCYIFKIRYLDTPNCEEVPLEDKENESKEESSENTPNSNLKVIYKNKYSFVDLLAKIFTLFLKFIALCIIIPLIFTILLLCIFFTIIVIALINKIISFGLLISVIASIIMAICILKLLIYFVFNNKINFKVNFIIFVASLCSLGVGLGITSYETTKYEYIDELPKEFSQTSTQVETFKYADGMYFSSMIYYNNYDLDNHNVTYKIDETLRDDIKITITKNDVYDLKIINNNNRLSIHYYENVDLKKYFNSFINNLKDKKIYNYSDIPSYSIVISGSERNLQAMKKKEKEEKQNQQNEEISRLETTYENKLNNYVEKIDDLNNQIDELNDENQGLKDQINEYKDKLSSLKETLN